MSEPNTLDEIRERKRNELQSEAGEDSTASEPQAPDTPIHVGSPAEFQETVDGYDVVLADFYADWCGPCKMLEPTVEALAAETDAAVAKVDVDEHQQLATQYRVQGVPTMVLFAGGEPVERIVGVREKAELAQLIEQHQK